MPPPRPLHQKKSLNEIEVVRREIIQAINSATKPADKRYAVQAKAAFDGWLDDVIDQAMFSGDPRAMSALKEARGLRTLYGKKFAAPDASGKIIQKLLDPELSPEQVMNYIFGVRGIGGNKNAVQTVRKLKNVLGEDSPDWGALREAAWMRLSKDRTNAIMTPKRLGDTMNTAMNENKTLLRTLFTDDEIGKMFRFADLISKTITPEAAKNLSRRAFTISNLFRALIGRAGQAAVFTGHPGQALGFYVAKRIPTGPLGPAGARASTRPLTRAPGSPTALRAGTIAAGREATQ